MATQQNALVIQRLGRIKCPVKNNIEDKYYHKVSYLYRSKFIEKFTSPTFETSLKNQGLKKSCPIFSIVCVSHQPNQTHGPKHMGS